MPRQKMRLGKSPSKKKMVRRFPTSNTKNITAQSLNHACHFNFRCLRYRTFLFFFVKSQMKNLKNKIVLHIPTSYYTITAHTSYFIITAHRYNCNQSNIVPEGTKQPQQPKESHKFVSQFSKLISPQLDYSSARERFVTCFGLYTSTGRFYCTNFKIITA